METILRSKLGINELNGDVNLNLGLGTAVKEILNTNATAEVDVDGVYQDELNSSKKYRLIFTINPVCSNVLFNALTEVASEAESEHASLVPNIDWGAISGNCYSTEKATRKQCIRDTEYSHPLIGGFTYYPGADMFNNHILRQDGFVFINPRLERDPEKETLYKVDSNNNFVSGGDIDIFNTIRDTQRDIDRNVLQTPATDTDGSYKTSKKRRHAYNTSNILSFDEAYENNLKENNGWFGFYNKSMLNTSSDSEKAINKVINYSDSLAGDFIDMFPDRTRFSFVPHMNVKQGNRMEKNWDYCLTYPFENDEKHPIVCDEETGINGLEFAYITGYTTDTGKSRILLLSTSSKHNLKENDTIRLYCGNALDEVFETTVKGFGDFEGNLKEYYFSIDEDERISQSGRFCKMVFNQPCRYYFRKFKKLPNFSGIGNHSEITDSNTQDFDSEISKLAFASTVYGDDTVQIVYTDDIDLSALSDNLGRPITDIYLTIVKNNEGHDEWYKLTGTTANAAAENVKWSSCFGKVSSGLDLPSNVEDNEKFSFDYNVRKLHGIDRRTSLGEIFLDTYGEIWKDNRGPLPVEDDLLISNDVFYGDLVEYSPLQVKETVIEEVFHRFNTLQREEMSLVNAEGYDFIYDDIVSDDEDIHSAITSSTKADTFVCVERKYNTYYDNSSRVTLNVPANLFPEGYFYKPHYRIHVADFNDVIAQSSDTQMEYSDFFIGGDYIVFKTEEPIVAGSEVILIENASPYRTVLNASTVTNTFNKDEGKYEIRCKIALNDGYDAGNKYKMFLKTEGIPSYAERYPDNSGRYLWRGLKNFSEVSPESEIYGLPFANGAHYIYKGLNFFLRRQDPDGKYGLNVTEEKLIEKSLKSKNKIAGLIRKSQTRPEVEEAVDYVKNTVFDIC